MKKIFLPVILLSGLVFAIIACNNGAYNANPSGAVSNAPNPIYVPPGSSSALEGTCVCIAPMSGDIDSVKWVSDSNGTFLIDTLIGSNRETAILGVDSSGKHTIEIFLPSYHGAATYSLASTSGNEVVMWDSTNVTVPYSNVLSTKSYGTLVITSDAGSGGYIKGNFSFKVYTSDGTKSHHVIGGYIYFKH